MKHRNGVGKYSNYCNQGGGGLNPYNGRVSSRTVLSDVVRACFFLSILTLTYFLLQNNCEDRYSPHHQSFYTTEKPTKSNHQATLNREED
jgi:hypothetical protein